MQEKPLDRRLQNTSPDAASGEDKMTLLNRLDAESPVKSPKDIPHYTGHRARLRQRFLEVGPLGLQDYELLEMILFGGIPRKDTKPLAKELLAKYGSLWDVLTARPERLRQDLKLSDTVIATLTVVGAAALRMTQQTLLNQPVLEGWQQILDYLRGVMGPRETEGLRILYLDSKLRLITDELMQEGTIDHTQVYPREIARRGLELNATAIIMIHNHPSGHPDPSDADIRTTFQVKEALKTVHIRLHDHLIIGKGGSHYSFRDNTML